MTPNLEACATAPAPQLLYVGEFPPSNHHGGAILLKRLLDRHPVNCLTVIASKAGMMASSAPDILKCRHIVFPVLRVSASRWVGRLNTTPNILILALVALRAVFLMRRRRVAAAISIVQGRYYLAAALACWITGTPHIAVVHDNFMFGMLATSRFSTLLRDLTRRVLRNAAHIYAVSPEMQRLVFDECGMRSEIQLPSTTVPPPQPSRDTPLDGRPGPVILFAGSVGHPVRDCLDLLVELIGRGNLNEHGLGKVNLHLCTPLTGAEIQKFGWNHPGIVNRGWVSQSELLRVLASADVLFLPYSFLPRARKDVETAFPSKIADYLASGTPILVFGPKYSSLVRYAREQGFAEVVDEFSQTVLASTIKKMTLSRVDRQRLAARARIVLCTNHDIERQRRQFYLTIEQLHRTNSKENDQPKPGATRSVANTGTEKSANPRVQLQDSGSDLQLHRTGILQGDLQ